MTRTTHYHALVWIDHRLAKVFHFNAAAKISAVETLDHPTDGELLAHARHFFRADDRMRLQV